MFRICITLLLVRFSFMLGVHRKAILAYLKGGTAAESARLAFMTS